MAQPQFDDPSFAFRRFDESDDTYFYAQPRFVAHIEPATIAAVTALYREFLSPDGDVLDLMSSWISHLPPEIHYPRVFGLGMNARELIANPVLTGYAVQNLNQNPLLPFADAEFDAATICVSIQYLTRPIEILRDLGRVLKTDAPLVITFSNRCFPTKAVLSWQNTDDAGHLALVTGYLQSAGNWGDIQKLDRTPSHSPEPLFAVVAKKK